MPKVIKYCQTRRIKMRKIIKKIINFFKWLWIQIKDTKNLIILLIVTLIMSSPMWICTAIGLIGNFPVLTGIAAAYFAFWLGPATPFWPLCIAITLLIRRIIDKKKHKSNTN